MTLENGIIEVASWKISWCTSLILFFIVDMSMIFFKIENIRAYHFQISVSSFFLGIFMILKR